MCGRQGVEKDDLSKAGSGEGGCVEDREWGREDDVWKTGSRGEWMMYGRQGVWEEGGRVEDRECGRSEDVWKTGSGGGRRSGGRQGVGEGGGGRQRNGERRRLSGRR